MSADALLGTSRIKSRTPGEQQGILNRITSYNFSMSKSKTKISVPTPLDCEYLSLYIPGNTYEISPNSYVAIHRRVNSTGMANFLSKQCTHCGLFDTQSCFVSGLNSINSQDSLQLFLSYYLSSSKTYRQIRKFRIEHKSLARFWLTRP